MKRADLFRPLASMLAGCCLAHPGQALAQMDTNPLVGVWTGQYQDRQTGAPIFETDVYNPDGSTIGTVRLSNGLTMRVFGRYQARQVGPNQVQVALQVDSVLPRQMCAGSPAGPTACQPFPVPPQQPPLTLTFIDQNTVQSVNGISRRDPSGGLSQAPVSETVVMPAPIQTVDPGPNRVGLPDLCMEGTTQCDISGWRKVCERWPNGQANWMQHGVRCREGYGKPEY